ncbi:bypass of stop codon protein 6 [[Candida] railenensis]|uniref:Bypass of stop codon protein 6 n=1 Tax=[Candida] railenensis TaxID=45579 RepID=A0A9P0QQF4_9ASCO|nr:bypass of stop codon protein 6 [[Candida] railenensis]
MSDKKFLTVSNWRVISCCCWTFSCGFSDAAPGALLPFIEDYYGISYTVVSLIWLANALGFIVIAALSHKIQEWLGMRKSLAFGCFLSWIMYGMVSSGSNFAVVVVGFFFGGAGIAIGLAQTNVYLARLEKSSTYLAYNHGSYGVGATISPLIATVFVDRGVPWNFFYLVLLAQMVAHGPNVWFAFQGIDNEQEVEDREDSASIQLDAFTSASPGVHASGDEPHIMIQALKNKDTWLMALFVLLYQGSEVSMAGWIVTYLLDYRHGNPSTVGYVASGFWGGLTIGRLFLTPILYKYFGSRRSVIVLGISAVIIVIIVWVVPNAVAAGCLVAISGILIGPNYTLLITMTTRIIPRKIQVISLTIMTAFGSSGGAIFPFFVGLISQSAGTYVVLPIFVALYSTMVIVWICLPNVERTNRSSQAVGFEKWWLRVW